MDEDGSTARKIACWVITSWLAVLATLSAYVSGSPRLSRPGRPKLEEWAYAGFAFAWTSAFVAHYLANDGPKAFMPLVLLVFVSYFTRPASRCCRS